jgi:hypothetical protein
VNGVEVIPANDATSWEIDLTLPDGTHNILVTTVDAAGR